MVNQLEMRLRRDFAAILDEELRGAGVAVAARVRGRVRPIEARVYALTGVSQFQPDLLRCCVRALREDAEEVAEWRSFERPGRYDDSWEADGAPSIRAGAVPSGPDVHGWIPYQGTEADGLRVQAEFLTSVLLSQYGERLAALRRRMAGMFARRLYDDHLATCSVHPADVYKFVGELLAGSPAVDDGVLVDVGAWGVASGRRQRVARDSELANADFCVRHLAWYFRLKPDEAGRFVFWGSVPCFRPISMPLGGAEDRISPWFSLGLDNVYVKVPYWIPPATLEREFAAYQRYRLLSRARARGESDRAVRSHSLSETGLRVLLSVLLTQLNSQFAAVGHGPIDLWRSAYDYWRATYFAGLAEKQRGRFGEVWRFKQTAVKVGGMLYGPDANPCVWAGDGRQAAGDDGIYARHPGFSPPTA